MTEFKHDPKKYEKIHNILFLVDILLTILVLLTFFMTPLSVDLMKIAQKNVPETLGGSVEFILLNAFYLIAFVGIIWVIFLPLHFYGSYVVEHKYGLSNLTKVKWFKDEMKSLLLGVITKLILIEALYLLLWKSPGNWWIWTAVVWIIFSIVMSKIYPSVILPLFYKVKPIENKTLAERIKKFIEKEGGRVLGIFEWELSAKTKKANAAFTGMGNTKRVILGDTLIKNYTDDEIETIIAHELGHHRFKHIYKFLYIGAGVYIVSFALINVIFKSLIEWRYHDSIDFFNIATFPLIALCIYIIQLVAMPTLNAISRFFERQADCFAFEKTNNPDAFISGMSKLAEQNLANKEPNAVIEFLLYSHPSISKRIKAAEEYKKDQSRITN
ncbi:MAG: M48 family metallopeptidase [Candidatus Auribacterota bacterium]|nr:M48 family metallopeptidase [Candidatus Auribacterota bacterium]